MRWQKQGLIYVPDGERWWAKRYAHLPTVDVVNDKIIRVYFAALDDNQFGRIGYVDLDANNPHRILRVAPEPILDIGELGTFDDSGVNPSCVVNFGGKKYLYYIGWQRCARVPYMLFAGLAISNDGEHFAKVGRVPVLERTDSEPFSRSAPCVRVEDNLWKIWYWSCVEWSSEEKGVHYNNVIRHATSPDGLHWRSDRHVCLEPTGKEYSVGRPWVIKDGGLYRMWYSIRSHDMPYHIGYAESADGIQWTRKDDVVGIEKSVSGWDSEMICYPCVVDVQGQRLMFYNGNRHGESGFGYAIQVAD